MSSPARNVEPAAAGGSHRHDRLRCAWGSKTRSGRSLRQWPGLVVRRLFELVVLCCRSPEVERAGDPGAVGVDEAGVGVAAVDPGEGARGGAPAGDERRDVEVSVAESADRLVHRFERFGEVVAAAAGGAERAENGSAESGGVGAFAGGVGDREPGAVAVLDEIEPVTLKDSSVPTIDRRVRARFRWGGDDERTLLPRPETARCAERRRWMPPA